MDSQTDDRQTDAAFPKSLPLQVSLVLSESDLLPHRCWAAAPKCWRVDLVLFSMATARRELGSKSGPGKRRISYSVRRESRRTPESLSKSLSVGQLKCSKEQHPRDGERAQQVKALGPKPANLSSIPGTLTVEGENQHIQVVLCSSPMCYDAYSLQPWQICTADKLMYLIKVRPIYG